ncbi:MAG: GntR family transcriptional regulator [Anaerolineae bacterium]|nr:GntR family transcriptional regulator [Anaerolineae bacterium]
MALDKNNPIPLYYQLVEQLKEQIQLGELKPGDQLPSERELSDQQGISRMTVRQAIAYLVQQGLLEVKRGIGTFVAAPKLSHDTLHLLGFTEEVMQRGGSVTSQVLEQSIVVPSASVASGLNLTVGAATVKLVRLRLAESIPLLLETTFLPASLCAGLESEDLTTQSLYALLETKYGLHLKYARQTLEATIANAYESQLFGIEAGTAMILLEGTTYLDTDQPVEYFKAVYRGDRFQFELNSQRSIQVVEMPNVTGIKVVLD